MEIVPLSQKNINEAIALTVKIFGSKPTDFDYPGKWMPASLNPSTKESKKIYASYDCTFCKYYVGIKNKSVIGTTGIYTLSNDEKSADWVAWYCLNPAYRDKGLGSQLLDFVIDLARKRKKKFIKLYTSSNNEIDKAIQLYKKRGFVEFKREIHPNTKEELVYMQLKL